MDELESTTLRPSIEIQATPAGSLPVAASKLAGAPYLAPGAPAPQGEHRPLTFLAQIRLADLPANDFLPDAGLLQFWIGRDDLYGADLGTPRAGDFKVIHYLSVDEPVNEEDVLAQYSPPPIHDEVQMSPFESNDSLAMSFTMTSQPVSTSDGSFDEAFADLWDKTFPEAPIEAWWKLPQKVVDLVYDRFNGTGHRLGGYPFFMQDDPRTTNALEKETVLLFQVDTDDNIMWGDAGVENFFILPGELVAGDFSRVAFTWDCG